MSNKSPLLQGEKKNNPPAAFTVWQQTQLLFCFLTVVGVACGQSFLSLCSSGFSPGTDRSVTAAVRQLVPLRETPNPTLFLVVFYSQGSSRCPPHTPFWRPGKYKRWGRGNLGWEMGDKGKVMGGLSGGSLMISSQFNDQALL